MIQFIMHVISMNHILIMHHQMMSVPAIFVFVFWEIYHNADIWDQYDDNSDSHWNAVSGVSKFINGFC